MNKEIIEYYIDGIIQTFPRTNVYSEEYESPFNTEHNEFNIEYQFANVGEDIYDLNNENREFNAPIETKKFITKLLTFKEKEICIEGNNILVEYVTKSGKNVKISFTIDLDNKILKYERNEEKDGVPIAIYKETYKCEGNKEEIYKEKDKLILTNHDIEATNIRSTTIYENNSYKETHYQKDIISHKNEQDFLEVKTIDDYMLKNESRILKESNNDNYEEYYLFYKTDLNENKKTNISSYEFNDLLNLKDDIYALENNETIYNLKHPKSKGI